MRVPLIIPDRAGLSAGSGNPRIRGAVDLLGSTARLRPGREMALTGEDAILACWKFGFVRCWLLLLLRIGCRGPG